jgi:hypothetical protein
MHKLLCKILGVFAAVWFIALFVAGFLAYFVSSSNGAGPVDGLGRPLSEAPILMRLFFGQEGTWAGGLWFVFDMCIFWGSIMIAVKASTWLKEAK